ncbi:MAG: hypothetical protein K2V38_00800 [Gemmataceae bacterium]|nr:hypothetical protein [Gemmataceae bacterium]
MNETEIETPRSASVEEQARVVMSVLREYSGKLAKLVAEFNRILTDAESIDWQQTDANEVAWLLDQSEFLRKPLLAILSRGSGLREHAPLEPLTRDELSLRMWETEVHLHHATRMAMSLRSSLRGQPLREPLVEKRRVKSGLPAGA